MREAAAPNPLGASAWRASGCDASFRTRLQISHGKVTRLQESLEHDEYDRIEEAFNDAVSVSLDPRGPDFLYEVIDGLALDAGASAVDVGCGEGRQTIELATRLSLTVQGVDPLERRMDIARDALSSLPPSVVARVTFQRGTAEQIPAQDASVDLILCREMLY